MPTADLRALAERLGQIRQCDCCYEGDGDWDGKACPCCSGTGQRLPTEAEVREAIFEAGVHFVDVGTTDAGFAGVSFGGDEGWRVRVENEEVETGTSVLLALLRALEAARDGR